MNSSNNHILQLIALFSFFVLIVSMILEYDKIENIRDGYCEIELGKLMVCTNNSFDNLFFDSKFEAQMKLIGETVPDDKMILTTTHAPQVAYFSDQQTRNIDGIKSKEELLTYMVQRNFSYLLIIDGLYSDIEMKSYFSKGMYENLKPEFIITGEYNSTRYHMILMTIK